MTDERLSKVIRLDPKKRSNLAADMYDFIANRLVGQRRAIRRTVSAWEYFHSPLWDPNEGPLLKALFLGPSGVGKTEVTKLIAEFLFENRLSRTVIDCSGYSERYSVSNLIGAPPGYTGYKKHSSAYTSPFEEMYEHAYELKHQKAMEATEENKMWQELVERVDQIKEELGELDENDEDYEKDKKFLEKQISFAEDEIDKIFNAVLAEQAVPIVAVVLFDEIEKAHADIHDWLLPVLDEGHTQLRSGDDIDFSRAFLIMTSNAGSREIGRTLSGRQPGFDGGPSHSDNATPYSIATKELERTFSPEFLGRVRRNIVVFDPLNENELYQVLELRLAKLRDHLLSRFPLELVITDQVKSYLVREALQHREHGARALVDELEGEIRDPLIRVITSNQIEKGDKVIVDLERIVGEDRVVFFNDTNARDKITIVGG